jgi:hypothetical protein
VFLHYVAACILLGLIVYFRSVAEKYIGQTHFLFAFVVDPFVMIYVLMIEMRLLGLIYRCNSERIGWY